MRAAPSPNGGRTSTTRGRIAPGDHVVFQFAASCGRCHWCLGGRPVLCEAGARSREKNELLGWGRRLSLNGQSLIHYSGIACFAEYAVVDRGSVVAIDRSIPLDQAAILGCAVLTGVGAVVNTAGVKAGDSVAVVGVGGVGLAAVLGARVAGASRIVAVDIHDRKLEIARELGATDTFNSRDPSAIAHIRDVTCGGVDHAIETAGAVAALQTALEITKIGGSTVTAGLSASDAKFEFNHALLVGQERSIKGSYMGSCVPARDIPGFANLYQLGKLPFDRLINARVGLEQIDEGFDALDSGSALRQIVMLHGVS